MLPEDWLEPDMRRGAAEEITFKQSVISRVPERGDYYNSHTFGLMNRDMKGSFQRGGSPASQFRILMSVI